MSGTWSAGWVTGDIVTAAEFRKGMGSVFDTTLGGAAATIDTGAVLPTTYAGLRAVLYGRGDAAAVNVNVAIRFNNDSGANYDSVFQDIRHSATVVTAESLAGTSATFGSIAAATAPASAFDVCELVIPQYGGTTGHKAAVAQSTLKTNTTTGTIFTSQGAVWWRSTAAINRITLLPSSGNFAAGTRLTVYAMGA